MELDPFVPPSVKRVTQVFDMLILLVATQQVALALEHDMMFLYD